ncbi:MAG TPA: gliding motility-associated ABC transporter substrate-binding protein GldG [Chitinophagales bacterium]|nr:gliding motility-associated ABC transporter substrate-binding protein GldG [Chitinophagales bacterium]MBP6154953.1 gliding motility-associated ABC transporter substrate-binding protein GldG [Chitinophagales bacterium]HQV78377.1 gliding motility-associated ABC transporter substrate-binding protein GldG [Chitinophagales bacterium]HQW79528.1 gliding motility-associated ABC transporter substrate-binding protein GldG [Chitinophagales bacterium]HRB66505.1 gliding motility-associated ABC transporte
MKKHYLIASLKALAISLLAVIFINLISNFFYHRFDLTEEKRYSLTSATKKVLNGLEENIDIEVYLTGKDLPAGIRILQNETRELLQEFRTNSKGKVTFHFYDINDIKDQKQRENFQLELVKKGLKPTNLEVKSNDGFTEKLVFPGAILKVNGREIPVQILENQFSVGAQGSLNNSLNFLEYKFINSIYKITKEHPAKIAFLQGHGELGIEQLQEFLKALNEQNFLLDKVDLRQDRLLKNNIDILIIAKPQTAFNENEKFLIDQFIMQGGKTMWLLDNIICDLDSFKLAPSIMAIPRDLNVDDLLFRYGVRINHNLAMDLYCNQIPIIESVGGNPQPKLFPWVFYPIAVNKKNHPIVKNLDPVAFKFASSIDTLANPNMRKTILLSTSTYSRLQPTPFQLFLEGAKQKPNPYLFNLKDIPLSVLLEGNFQSLYKNQFTEDYQKLLAEQQVQFQPKSKSNKMIVVSDGDVAANDLDAQQVPLALGYDKYTRQLFANKDFLLNSVEYLIDDNNLIDARNREIKMRLLDKAKVLESKGFWQLITFGFPLLLISIFGIIYSIWRKKKYAH